MRNEFDWFSDKYANSTWLLVGFSLFYPLQPRLHSRNLRSGSTFVSLAKRLIKSKLTGPLKFSRTRNLTDFVTRVTRLRDFHGWERVMARANFVSFVENNISCNKYKSNHGTFINIYHDVELKLIINKYFLQREHSSSNSKSTTFIFLKR